MFVTWKDAKFQKSYNFPSNKHILTCLRLNLIVHINTVWFITFYHKASSNMQNIPPLEQVINKGKDKNIAGLPK